MKKFFCMPLVGLFLLTQPYTTVAQTIKVWPGKPPGENGKIGEEKVLDLKPGERKVMRITNVTEPMIKAFHPPSDKDSGAAVLICPGGGYNILAWDLEGEEVAHWLNSIGVTGFVLKYRVPKRPDQTRHGPPLQDAQRALSLLRSKAKELKIDTNRIGILGFSAGGHLSAATSTNFDKRFYEPIDNADTFSCRPDFTVLIYPAYLVEKDLLTLSPEIRVSSKTPPTFFAHAGDDPIKAENSIQMHLALRKAGVPTELHIYPNGGHGFGLRPTDQPCSTWPARCAEWFRIQGILKKSP